MAWAGGTTTGRRAIPAALVHGSQMRLDKSNVGLAVPGLSDGDLTTITGNITISTPGLTMVNTRVVGQITVNAPGVTLRNVKADTGFTALRALLLNASATSFYAENCDFRNSLAESVAMTSSGGGYTDRIFKRCVIHRGPDALKAGDCTMIECWVGDVYTDQPGAHHDVAQNNDYVRMIRCRLHQGVAADSPVQDGGWSYSSWSMRYGRLESCYISATSPTFYTLRSSADSPEWLLTDNIIERAAWIGSQIDFPNSLPTTPGALTWTNNRTEAGVLIPIPVN